MDVKGLERSRAGLRRNLKVLKRNPATDCGRLAELEISIANVGCMIKEAEPALGQHPGSIRQHRARSGQLADVQITRMLGFRRSIRPPPRGSGLLGNVQPALGSRP